MWSPTARGWFGSSVTRSAVALTAVFALVVGLTTATAPRARAAEDGVTDLLSVLGVGGGDDNLAAWTSDLATIGKLGEQLPLVAASPGGLLGYADLFQKAVTDELAAANTFGDLDVDRDISIGGDRSGHLTTSVSDLGDGKRLDITVDVDKTVAGQDLHLTNTSPKVDLTVSDGITVALKSRLALSMVWTGPGEDTVYIVSEADSPRIDLDATASIDTAAAKAAFGILGVSLDGSSLDLAAHFAGQVSDPDNDGKLFFTENTSGDGELAQDGSLEGLVDVGFDPQGSQPIDDSDAGSPGSATASFQLGAAAASAGLDLPSGIDATITVDWPDVATGAPAVSAPGVAETVGKFANMSLEDLASGIAQVTTSITAIQQARFDPDGDGPLPETGDLDLPFMRGSLSDAIDVGEKLKDFLAANTEPAPGQTGFVEGVSDPAQAGQPTFTSLQDMLAELDDAGGIDLSDLAWNTGTSKLVFTAGMTKAAPDSGASLDESSAAASGASASYGAKTLTVTGTPWQPNEWVGRRVTAGTAAGEVASNTANQLTLTTDWIGGPPADGTPFVIAGAEAHLGAVTFANQLNDDSGHGIANANADQTFATVKPSFDASLTLVLDLRDPVTGADCDGFEGNTEPCPFTKTDGPFETQVESLPLNTDRVMLRTGSSLFDADLPINTGVDFTANAGFFKVHLTGSLTMCHTSQSDTCTGDPSGHMLTVALDELGDAENDIRMSELFRRLSEDPASLLDINVNVRAYSDVTVSIPDADDFLPVGATAAFTARWHDLEDPSTIEFNTADLSEIFDLDFDADNPKALFTLLIKTLQTVSTQLASANTSLDSGVFSKEIPGLGRSLRDLLLADESNSGSAVSYGANTVTDSSRSGDDAFTDALVGRSIIVGTQVGVIQSVSGDGKTLTLTKDWDSKPADGTGYAMRSALDDAIDQLLAAPPDNIQDAVERLNATLGTNSVSFRYLETGGTPNLVLDVDWQRDYRVSSPIKLSLGNVGGSDRTFAGAEATGQALVDVTGRITLGLLVPLEPGTGPANGNALRVLEDSAITVGAKASLTNGVVKGVIGPLSIALGNPASGAPAAERAQVNADISLALAKTGASQDTPVSFNDFIGAVEADFNATNDAVECGEGLDTELMVCASLPMYLNNSGASDGWTSIGDVALRLPDSTDPADLFDFSGTLPAPDDDKKKLRLPSDLATKLAEAILDFGNLGDGLEAYLVRIEQAFRTAAFNGKLPLVGEDLQKGADFIGDLRSSLRGSIWDELPGAGRPANAEEFEDFINANLADALADAGIAAEKVKVAFSCTATLQRASAPTVTPTSVAPGEDEDPPSDSWQYKVVAYQGDGTESKSDTVPSNAGSATNYGTLDDDNFNTITWSRVDNATGYKILRKGPGDTAFELIKKLGDVTSYDDKGDSSTAYTAATEEPELEPCPGESIDGVLLEFNAQRGNVTASEGCTSSGAPQPCINADVPLDIGIPGLALRQGDGNADGIDVNTGFQLHFRLGLNKADGFFVATRDGWGSDSRAHPELQVGLSFDLPDAMVAELAFFDVDVTKATGAGHTPATPLFAGAFQLDLKSMPDQASCFTGSESGCVPDQDAKLTFAELGGEPTGDLFGISLTGQFHIDWIVEAQVDSAFPGIRANFQLLWGFDNNAPSTFGAPTIAFNDVGVSAGSFFEGLLGPVVKKMKQVTGPVQPVVDTLYAPIPVLSDLSRAAGGDDVTLVTLAKTFSTLTGGPKLEFVDTIKSVVAFLNRLPSCATECFVPLGSFTLNGDEALSTSNSPTTADTMYASQSDKDGGTLDESDGDVVKAAMNGKNSNPAAAGKPIFSTGGGDGDAEKSGFSFPILDNPAEAFNLIMGGDVTLVKFDSGPLRLGFSWRQEFGPVYAPPPVLVTMAGSAEVSLRVVAGLDTYGLRKGVEAIANGTKTTPLDVLDGLFFATVDDNGVPIPVVTLSGEIAAGAAVSAFVIKVGIEGGLRLTIAFYWNDPNDDGKFRVSEFLQAALNNPACLFSMSGKLALFLRVYITLGVGIFSTKFSFTLADVTLLDFSVTPDCEPPPPKLGGTVGDTLVVYAGKLGGAAFRGHPVWSNTGADYEEDTVKVVSLHYAQRQGDLAGTNPDFDGFGVQMLGETRQYLDPGLQRVVVDGTGYNKPMTVTFNGDGKQETGDDAGNAPTTFEKEAVVIGSNGGDTISTGTGRSYVDGRGGEDIIVTADTGSPAASKSWVAGGPDVDTITVGDGDNRITGDATLGSATASRTVTHNSTDGGGNQNVTVIDWTQLADPTTQPGGAEQDDDTIGVGLGTNVARGNDGADKIGVDADAPDGSNAAGNNVLIGDSGGDKLSGGTGDDKIFTAARSKFNVDAMGPADAGATNVVDTGEGSDHVWGSTGVDLVTSHATPSQQATLRGGGLNDVLIGGFGTDRAYGGPGHDYVIAEPADVSGPGAGEVIDGRNYGPKRTVTKLPLPDGVAPNTKRLVGGTGNDHIVGGDGPATMFGDGYLPAEKCAAGDPVAADPVAESTTAAEGDGNDLITGGAGVDTVSAGGGHDIANVFGEADLACGQHGRDTLRGGDDADHMWGGSNPDVFYGGDGADFAFGNTGNDTAYGGAAVDVIEGNDGADWASGGSGADVVYGGTRAAGRTDSGDDDLYGDLGADVLIGDNGSATEPYPFDLDGDTPAAGAGDRVHGGAADDHAYGGLGNDIVNGNAGDDYLEGNNGSDTAHGNDGEDRIIGGSSEPASAGTGRPDTGDVLAGDAGPDLIAGDNASLRLTTDASAATRVTRARGFAQSHVVELLDLGLSPAAGTSGADEISGGTGQDVAYGQNDTDRVKGESGADYAEGGPGIDWLEGDSGDDDLVGGSSTPLAGTGAATSGQPDAADAVFGGPGDDAAAGDNGQVLRPLSGQDPTRATVRLGSTSGQRMTARVIELYDRGADPLVAPQANRFGADRMSGGSGIDVIYGQDAGDYLSGGANGDYFEGNGGADVLRGDLSLDGASSQTDVQPLADPGWPGAASGPLEVEGATTPDGQDDLIGGSSARGFRDAGDTVQGDGADDVELGDNGTLVRTVEGPDGSAGERVYADRYPNDAVPADATRSRTHDQDAGDASTRFCTTDQVSCEVSGAFGGDVLYGNGGDDGMWGQDGDDTLRGGSEDDDMFGELGDDALFGEAGEDALLGDRGGVVNQLLDTGDSPAESTTSLTQPPAESYTGFRRGLYDRRVDLLHDVDGDQWIGDATDSAMPHDGITEGGRDRIRGGLGNDNIHAGFGDDLANGDSGGDQVFGGDGEDVLWGGKGCDPVADAAAPDCLTGDGSFNPDSRGADDRFVDHVFGGVGESDPVKQDVIGSDILDFNPRGPLADCAAGDWPVTTGSGKNAVTNDPCVWFEMTEKDNTEVSDNQHHHGIDWIYGGWDRDVLQADLAQNGPNPGDRLIDWTGAYNLYTHCNAAYGGFNDIRLIAPDLEDFLTGLAFGSGAGRGAGDLTTPGTSAFRELAFTYQADFKEHGNGKAYPNTPGHFDDPVSCED